MNIKNTSIIILFFLNLSLFSQTTIKLNGISTIVLIPQVGFETKINSKLTFQLDAAYSPWKSVKNAPFEFFMVIPEIRFYPKQAFKGFYIGAHIGGSAFKVQKWEYKNTNYYQEGYNYLLGGTLGYQTKLSEKFALDIFVGGGSQQAFYKGFDSVKLKRIDKAKNYNKSGEWIPYRGGIMLCYKL